MKSVPCPLMPKEAYAHLSERDRLCHVPGAKQMFEQAHPGITCSEGGRCQACQDQSISVRLELQLQEYASSHPRGSIHFQA
ncbi:MAG: hypothetical protein KA731_00090 [Candidatus Moranbacteria bacterium]|nr:hypothetical protein [Candidatus Moranbacteria bacterium]